MSIAIAKQAVDDSSSTPTHSGGIPLPLPKPTLTDVWINGSDNGPLKDALEGINLSTDAAGNYLYAQDGDETLSDLPAIYDGILLSIWGAEWTVGDLRTAIATNAIIAGNGDNDNFTGQNVEIYVLEAGTTDDSSDTAPLLCEIDNAPEKYGFTSVKYGFINSEITGDGSAIIIGGVGGSEGTAYVKGVNAAGETDETVSDPITPHDSSSSKISLAVTSPPP